MKFNSTHLIDNKNTSSVQKKTFKRLQMNNNNNLSAIIPQGINPKGKRNHRGEVIPKTVDINDDCMREILDYLNWNEFINLCEGNPHFSRFDVAMTNKTYYMGPGLETNVLARNYVHLMKNMEVNYAVPENELGNIMNFVEGASAVENLIIHNPPGPLYHVTSNVIKKLTMETDTQQQEWDPMDQLEPIIRRSHGIRELTCINGLLGQHSLTHLIHNPVTKLVLIDTMVDDSLNFLTYLYLAIDLKHMEILGGMTFNLQSTFFQYDHPCRSRLTNLTIELISGLGNNAYNNIINFTELIGLKIYYKDPYLLQRVLSTLAQFTNPKLKSIVICENLSSDNPLMLGKLRKYDNQNFQLFTQHFAHLNITLTRQDYIFNL